jgi:hypothetical protein
MSFLTMGIVEAAADQALDREERVLGIGDGLPLGGLSDEAFLVREGDDRGGRARSLGVLDDPGLAPVHDGDAGVGGAEVDTDDFCHEVPFPRRFRRPGPLRPPPHIPDGTLPDGADPRLGGI